MGRAGPIKPLQRFLCMGCGASFTFERKTARPRARFTEEVVEEAVRLYIQGLSSYRVLAVMLEQRLGRSVSLHAQWLGSKNSESAPRRPLRSPAAGGSLMTVQKLITRSLDNFVTPRLFVSTFHLHVARLPS